MQHADIEKLANSIVERITELAEENDLSKAVLLTSVGVATAKIIYATNPTSIDDQREAAKTIATLLQDALSDYAEGNKNGKRHVN